jgi:hypothetical protein
MNHTTHWLHLLQKLSDTYIYTAEISTVEFSPCVWVLVWPSNPPFNPQFQCFIPNPPRIWTNSWVTSILLHLFRKEPERNLVLISSSSPSDLTPTKRRPLKEGGCIRLEWTSNHQCTSLGWGRSSCFGDELKTHPLHLPRDFSAPFSAPKFSPPTYFPPPPTSLTSFPAHSISRAQESSQAWIAESFNETWDTRLEGGGEFNVEGMWRGESKKSASSQM